MMACGGMVQGLPLVFVPLLFRHAEGWRLRGRLLLLVAAILVFFAAPFVSSLGNLFDTLRIYAQSWSFNGGMFHVVSHWLGDTFLAKAVCGVGLLAVVLVIARRVEDPLTAMVWTLVSFGLCAVTVYPWYVVPLVPLLVVRPVRVGWGLVILTQISYVVLIEYYGRGVWMEDPRVWWAQYLPITLLLGWDFWNRWSPRIKGSPVVVEGGSVTPMEVRI
jgi:hypothetical protein